MQCFLLFLCTLSTFQGKIVAQGKLLLQDTFLVTYQDTGLLPRCKERRVFLFEQIVIFSEPLDKKKGFSMPGFLFKNSIKVTHVCLFSQALMCIPGMLKKCILFNDDVSWSFLLLGRKVTTNLNSLLKKTETLFCQLRSVESKLRFFQ